ISLPAMSEAVHAFFSQWEIYRLCIEHNTLFHREVGEILRRELVARTEPFTFLDLACGDADLTAAALHGTKVGAYTGVDFSAPALALAGNKTAELRCPRSLHEADFTRFLRENKQTFDVVYLGLSLHHLERENKRETMKDLRRAVAPGGPLYLFEPILHGGESREGYVARWAAAMDGPYDLFPAEARAALRDHVTESERPESAEDYQGFAVEAGFTDAEILFTDPGHFYCLFKFST
ncbi:MAG: class I SAM-dependent methyltransferase, partial [Chthoniobacterales bacterium]